MTEKLIKGIPDWVETINDNFGIVENDITNTNLRVTNLVINSGNSNAETTDARSDIADGKVYKTLKDRLDNQSQNIINNKNDIQSLKTKTTKVESSITNGNIKIDGIETNVYTHPNGTNPHGTTKIDIGISNVDNTSDLDKPVSNLTQKALDNKVDKVIGKSLILDSEIQRLSTVINFDSTNLQQSIKDINNNLSNVDNKVSQVLNLVDLMLSGTNIMNENFDLLTTDTDLALVI